MSEPKVEEWMVKAAVHWVDFWPLCHKQPSFLAKVIANHAPKPEPSRIRYRNYRGIVADRDIIPGRIYWGSNEWHPQPQWLLDAWDITKGEKRTFAVSGLLPVED